MGGAISAPSGRENYIGGILGLATSTATVSRCRSEFNLSARTDVGGIVGYLRAGSIYQCCYKGDITSREASGGIVGWIGENSSISDCCTSGTFSSSMQIMGGIAGDVLKNTTVSSCYSTAKRVGGRSVGGIIRRLCNAGWSASGISNGNKVDYCIAWNPSLSATGTSGQAGSGAVVGFTGTKNSFNYCYRRYDFSFSCTAVPSGVTALTDQGRSTSDITVGVSAPYWYPYHASRVSSPSEYPNVTAVVKYIDSKVSSAWDTGIWNLEVPYPELVGVGGSGAGGEDPVPEPGIRPGDDWEKTGVADGIDYYYFHKTDAITGKIQSVHVTTVDLSSDRWSLKLYYDESRHRNSDVLSSTGAEVSINGGYETGSIVIRKDGHIHFNITNDLINGTDVPNWKNEGAVCFNEGGPDDIAFSNAGIGETVDNQRTLYRLMTLQNIISSAPVLIHGYEQYGTTFCSRHSGSSWGSGSENPYTHQNSAYPRTAIGMTQDGHLLLVVVDGRFPSQAVGMSAANLTKFIAKYFNPEYLLNLDGGGSSTMCPSMP